jgi:hypothetical protein
MNDRLVDRIPFAKIVIVLAVAFGIGLGLCGVDLTFLNRFRGPDEEFGANTIIGGIGFIAMVLSALGLVLTCVVWAVVGVVGAFSQQESETQRLFEDKDDEDKLR